MVFLKIDRYKKNHNILVVSFIPINCDNYNSCTLSTISIPLINAFSLSGSM